jgi:hypothetical protein
VVNDTFPESVRRFLSAHIETLDAVEVLLLLFGEPERPWTADEVGRECRTNEWAAGVQLRALTRRGLLRAIDGPGDGPAVRYQAERGHKPEVDRLARTYRERRVGVITFIYNK